MNRIIFIEGTPGVGKTTFVQKMMKENANYQLVCGDDVVPENMVHKSIKSGRILSIPEARKIYCEQSYEEYRNEHLRIWRAFCEEQKDTQTPFLVDAGLIQAPLYELMGLYMLPPEKILLHLQEIIDIVNHTFLVQLVYINTYDHAQCIRKAITTQQELRKDWVKGFCTWLEVAPYPMMKGYTGVEGIERFVSDRFFVDSFLLDNLSIQKQIYSRTVYD